MEPIGWAPVLLTGPEGQLSRFPRAMCRFTAADGRTGHGWTEWNQPASEAAVTFGVITPDVTAASRSDGDE